VANHHRDIFDVLAAAGIERTRGKMICPHCEKRAITANQTKGVATCWGCQVRWSVNNAVTPPAFDWAIQLVSDVATACMEDIESSQEAKDWLRHRGLPVSDINWLIDNDLGTVPDYLDIQTISKSAKQLWAEDRQIRMAEVASLRTRANIVKGKEGRADAAKAERIEKFVADEDLAIDHVISNVLPLLTRPEWRDALVYVYRDADGNPCSLNVRQYQSEPEERKVMRVQPRANKRGVFGVTDAQYDQGECWQGRIPPLTIVEGEHNMLSLRAFTHRWGYGWYIPVVAIGGKTGVDVTAIKALTGNQDPLVIHDNDTINPKTGLPGGYELVDAISTEIYCNVTTTPGRHQGSRRLHQAQSQSEADTVLRGGVCRTHLHADQDLHDRRPGRCETLGEGHRGQRSPDRRHRHRRLRRQASDQDLQR
jgi:hypothetical protein